jgi:hypothetical protein
MRVYIDTPVPVEKDSHGHALILVLTCEVLIHMLTHFFKPLTTNGIITHGRLLSLYMSVMV